MVTFVDPEGPETMIHWLPKERRKVATVILSVKKLDEVWRRDPFTFVGVGGNDIKFEKLQQIDEWLEAGNPLWKPIIESVLGDPMRFTFVDGRHRVAVLRARGIDLVPFVVPIDQAEAFLRCFGPE